MHNSSEHFYNFMMNEIEANFIMNLWNNMYFMYFYTDTETHDVFECNFAPLKLYDILYRLKHI